MSCSNTTSIVTCSSFASVFYFSKWSIFLNIFNGLLISLYHDAKARQVIFNHIHIASHMGVTFCMSRSYLTYKSKWNINKWIRTQTHLEYLLESFCKDVIFMSIKQLYPKWSFVLLNINCFTTNTIIIYKYLKYIILNSFLNSSCFLHYSIENWM